jgi:putative membrane protein
MKNLTFFKQTMIHATFVALIFLVASCGSNQPRDTKEVAEDQNEARFNRDRQEKDAQFLVNMAEVNMEQIQLGQLAQQKGTTTHVKELGKIMEDTHTKSQRDLTALARSKSVTIPTSPTNKVRDVYNNLNEKSGNDFDKAYADMMVSRNEDAIKAFEKATTESYDTDIKNWAIATLPDLRTNLNHSIDSKKRTDELR